MLRKLLHFTITAKEKAAYAFLVSAVGTYMVQSGVTLHQVWTATGFKALLVGVITHQFTYWVTNSTRKV